ncbi:RNA polymerase factor sigma-32 [Micavibrio aeruginosavorus]|uniref:RNA polymerase sigma factor n=1 Tax=Micavibrio aeruginosavorus EPB TaxID=349215 RepID=M4VIC2_9BACT|nr:RNA polymerase factor sigma-32 [Micavibrio aeruginosavorus]AGH98235.1 RNA polymerase sigma factor RpoH-related protein [Micavibrio aeruginosavorus EPB]
MAHIDDQGTQKANLSYIRTSMNEPLLERDHELDLARRWREDGDERALHELVRSYTRLVIAMASRFRNYGLPLGDLIQEGNIGLMQAANRFEHDRGVRFSTYATWWIRSAMQDYVLRNWSIVRTGTTAAQKSLFFNLRRLRSKIEAATEREGLTTEGRTQIAKELKVNLKDVEDMEGRLSASDHSLNARIGMDGEDEWQSLLSDERPNPEEIVIGMKDAQTRSQWLNEALSELSDRERTIITERHLGHEAVTLEDLGKELGVSKERVRQLEQRAMSKLRQSMTRHIDDTDDILLEG